MVFLIIKTDFFSSSFLRPGSLEAESEMSCVKVIYPGFSRRKRMRNNIGEGKGAKQGFGFGWNLASSRSHGELWSTNCTTGLVSPQG